MDTSYATENLSREQQEKLLQKAHSLCMLWWLDKLDCSVSLAREIVKGATFEEAMAHFVPGTRVTVIHRRPICSDEEEIIEVGFRSMEEPADYFLWIIVPMDKADVVLKGLKERR